MARDLVKGAGSIFRAMGMMLRDPRVRRLSLAPALINIVVVVIGLPAFLFLSDDILAWFVPGLNDLAPLLRGLVQLLALLLFAIIGIVLLLVVGRIVAAPFMSRLSEAVEAHMLGDRFVPRATSLRDDVADGLRGILFALGRLILFLLLYPPILLLGLIPVIGPVLAPVLSFLYGALVLSLDFSEPAFERHLPGFRRRLRHVMSRPLLYLGFGSVAVAMALVPFANFVVLPVCVAAATIVFLESHPSGDPPL
jgi:CysZ protein